MLWLSRIAFGLAILDILFMIYLTVTGFPPEIAGVHIKLKNMRKPFLLLVGLVLAGIFLHPERKLNIQIWKGRCESFLARPYAIWILIGLYAVLFTWQQLSEYFAVKINFIPFGFFDYMFPYFFQGQINYTGLLHGHYHLNHILIFLAPLWFLVKSSLFLVVVYGPIAALGALPLYAIAKEKLNEPVLPFLTAFIYLNYKHLQNVLLVNFSVEIFYPLFLFSALYFAIKKRWGLFYLFVFLGLLVKEDSFIYFGALSLLVFFLPKGRVHAGVSALMSVLYFVFLIKFFIPWTGSTILEGDLKNYQGHGESVGHILFNLAKSPLLIVQALFGSLERWETYFKLISRLGFFPLFSPAAILILAPILPLFLHSMGRDTDFVELNFHYAAAVIAFVFIAFVFGFSNLYKKIPQSWKGRFVGCAVILLLLLNGGNYVTRRITPETLESIRWAQSVPLSANLVTHGHLLPYAGYRKNNYYFAQAYERKTDSVKEAYMNADYYLIDLNADLYPENRDFFDDKIKRLSDDPRYELLRHHNDRYLFKRTEPVA